MLHFRCGTRTHATRTVARSQLIRTVVVILVPLSAAAALCNRLEMEAARRACDRRDVACARRGPAKCAPAWKRGRLCARKNEVFKREVPRTSPRLSNAVDERLCWMCVLSGVWLDFVCCDRIQKAACEHGGMDHSVYVPTPGISTIYV